MKTTKQQLKQIIKEEVDASEELIDAIERLTRKINSLDTSVDYLAASITGEDPLSIGSAQRARGRAARPTVRAINPEPKELEEIVKEEMQDVLFEKCWKGYEKKGMKKMFGKMYPNCVKKKKGKKRKKRKNESADLYEADPKKGTGKKPKGSGRRLYTDEDPSDTVSVKFSTVQDIKDTLSKASFKSKSHKRQSQIINLIHQRARAAYNNAKDPKVKARLKKSYDYAKKRKEASKKKTQSMNKAKDE